MVTQAKFEITATDKTAQVFESIDKRLAGISKQAIGLDKLGGLVAGALGVGALDQVLEVTEENEKAQALLASQIKATGDASGYTLQQLTDMADGFQKTTTYSHTQVAQLETELMAFRNVAGTQFKGAIQAALDFATVTGRDPVEAIKVLGIALNDPVKGMNSLRRAGISLTDSTRESIQAFSEQGNIVAAQDVLLKAMEQSYGGAAAAARDTLGGAIQGLKHDFDSLLEADGGGVKGVTEAVKNLDKVLQDPELKAGIQTLISGVLTLTGVVAKAAEAFANLGKNIGETFARAVTGDQGNFDDQIARYQELIQQTKDEIKGLSTGVASYDSKNPAIQALERQLAEYKYHLQDVQLYQKAITGGGSQDASKPNSPGDIGFIGPMQQNDLPSVSTSGLFGDGSKKTDYDKYLEDQKKVIEIWKQNDPDQFLKQQIADTQTLVGTVVDGALFTADDAAKHIQKLREEFSKTTDQMTEFSKEAARNIQDEFAKGLFDGFHHGLRGMVEDFAKTLEKMLDQLIASQLLNQFFGASDPSGKGSGEAGLAAIISKGLGSFMGGGHAAGGSVSGGTMYPVNEMGPELFSDSAGNQFLLPDTDGTITPNSALVGAGGRGVTVHIDARGAGPDEVARLTALGAGLENSLKTQMEYRLQRGGWPTGKRRP